MSQSKYHGLFWGLLVYSQAQAINPVSGVYSGVFLGPTYTPSIAFTLNPTSLPKTTAAQRSLITSELQTYLNVTADELNTLLHTYNGDRNSALTYSVLGGIGGQIGYRFCSKYRAELEFLYNNNPFNQLQIGNIDINNVSSSATFHIGGDTNTGAGMFNFYYDLLTPSNDYFSAVAPYVGLGLGYAYVVNSLQFHYGSNTAAVANDGATPATLYELNLKQSHTTYAGQAIIGISYFMDDFCWISADVRYFATGKTTTTNPINQNTFERKTELISFMIGFNGVLDFG